MKSVWLITAIYKTGGVLAEDVAVVVKKTKPSSREMEIIFKSAERAQSWEQVKEIGSVKIEMIEL